MSSVKIFKCVLVFSLCFPSLSKADKACEDLFSAACLGDGAARNRENNLEKLTDESKSRILAARNKAAKESGFVDFADQVRAQLAEAGYEVVVPIDENFRKWVENGKSLAGADVFKSAKMCNEKIAEFNLPNAVNFLNSESVSTQTVTVKAYNNNLQSMINEKYSNNLSAYYSQLETRCDLLKSNMDQGKALAEENSELSATCGRIGEIRQKSIELSRTEGTPEGQKEALEFVSANPLRSIVFKLTAQSGYGSYGYGLGAYGGGIGGMTGAVSSTEVSRRLGPQNNMAGPIETSKNSELPSPQPRSEMPMPQQGDSTQLNQEMMEKQREMQAVWSENTSAKMSTYNLCSELGSVLKLGAEAKFNEILETNSKDKRVVEAVLDSFYPQKTVDQMQNDFVETKEAIVDILKLNIKDQELRNKIISTMDEVDLFIPQKPTSEMYTKIGGIDILNTESTKNPMDTSTLSIFSDPSLNFFTTANAMYMPRVAMGNISQREKVVIMPTLAMGNEMGMSLMVNEVLAHEVGHRIGPKVSIVNGYDLNEHYSTILNCYRSPKSIRMQENQTDETMSDYFASEVIARKVSKLPAAQRRSEILKSVEFYCKADNSRHGFNCKDTHPTPTFRVSGIFGGNPSIRKMLGCSGESSKYQSCGLSKSILDSPSVSSPRRLSGPANSEQNGGNNRVRPSGNGGVRSAK